jgi:hypothetical protein
MNDKFIILPFDENSIDDIHLNNSRIAYYFPLDGMGIEQIVSSAISIVFLFLFLILLFISIYFISLKQYRTNTNLRVLFSLLITLIITQLFAQLFRTLHEMMTVTGYTFTLYILRAVFGMLLVVSIINTGVVIEIIIAFVCLIFLRTCKLCLSISEKEYSTWKVIIITISTFFIFITLICSIGSGVEYLLVRFHSIDHEFLTTYLYLTIL